MAETAEILCLVNSRRRNGRSVAGLRTDGGGWIRPIGMAGDGTLLRSHCRLADSSEPRLFDILRIGLHRPAPKSYHPESWCIDGTPWELQARPGNSELIAGLLQTHTRFGPGLLGSTTNRIMPQAFAALAHPASLGIVQPQTFRWRIATGRSDLPSLRAIFALRGNITYDLPVADPDWEKRLRALPVGDYPMDIDEPSATPGSKAPLPSLVVSLTEPTGSSGMCYKFVAAVLASPGIPSVL